MKLLAALACTWVELSRALVVSSNLSGRKDEPVPWFVKVSGGELPSVWTLSVKDGDVLGAIKKMKTDSVLVEMFSPYCPHCMHFAPELERVAQAISTSGSSITVAKLNCVAYHDACIKFSTGKEIPLPNLVYGSREEWLSSKRVGLKNLEGEDAEAAASSLQKVSGIKLDLMSKEQFLPMWLSKQKVADHKPVVSNKVDQDDLTLAVAIAVRNGVWKVHEALDKKASAEAKNAYSALADFVVVLSKTLSSSCRSSMVDLLDIFEKGSDLKRKSDWDIDAIEKKWKPCGKSYSQLELGWGSCQGSMPGKRGYSCGLWSLFHTVAANSDDSMALSSFRSTRAALKYIFDCQDCVNHFFEMKASDDDAKTQQDAQLWWWSSHNDVNERVGKEEEQNMNGDPLYVKTVWPPESLCKDRHSTSGVLDFLGKFYGN